jgi:acyl CoA:acetate/3-ketoacid CoA transferase alpha subunit
MSVGVGGSTMSRTPMAIIWELMRQRRKHLSCSRSIVSTDGDLLFGSDMADEVVTSWFAQGILWGLSKVMRHHVEKGGKRFQEWSHMAMGMRFRAGGMGVPFLPIRSMLAPMFLSNARRPGSSTALSRAKNCCSSPRSTQTLRSFTSSAAILLATPRSTDYSSWTSISRWPPIG